MTTRSEKMAEIKKILNDLHREHDMIGAQIDNYVQEAVRIRDMSRRDFEEEFNDNGFEDDDTEDN